MTEPARTLDDWGRRYESVRPTYIAFTDALEQLMESLLEETPVDIAQIEARTKTVESFTEKLARKGYSEPMEETTDLVGIRIIVYDPADCHLVADLIDEAFLIDRENSAAWSADTDPERFGYRSDHYQVALLPKRCELHEWRRFADLGAEIQVRTVMQHAWAAVDHRIGYKQGGLPSEIRHRLSRLSALLELADLEFARALADSRARRTRHAESVAEGELGAVIDALSLTAFIDQTELGRTWTERAISLDYLEPRSEHADVTGLVDAARRAGLDTLRDFHAMFSDLDHSGEDILKKILEITLAGWPANHRFAGIPAHQDLVLTLLLLVASNDPQVVEAVPLRADIKDAVLQLIGARSA